MADNNAAMTENDYYEASKVEFDMAIKSEAFGFNSTLSTEVISCEYLNKDNNDVKNQGNMKMDFSHIFQMTLLIMQLLHLNIRKSSLTGCSIITCS